MRKINLFLSSLLIFCLVGICACRSNHSVSQENSDEFEESIFFSDDENTQEGISYITGIIKDLYPSSKFDGYPQSMEETLTKGRYEFKGKFLVREDNNVMIKYYSTFAQKYDNQWEFGTLLISNTPNPNLSNATKIINGHLKEKEQESINKKEDGSLDGIDYKIIKRSEPNYIFIYTPKRLKKKDIIKFYDKYKDSYESIRFTTSMNPNDDDYFCIQDPYVFDYSKKNAVDAMSKLKDFLKD